jgi:hypothetical protein
MSWKLTTKQKANVDLAWESVVRGKHPQRPLDALDEFFERVERRPESAPWATAFQQADE